MVHSILRTRTSTRRKSKKSMDKHAPEETIQDKKSLTLSNEKMQQLIDYWPPIRITGTRNFLISGEV